MRIFVVDDNPEALFVIARFLKALDHQVTEFENAQEVILWLKDGKPEMIIADLDMPTMDGYTLVRYVRAQSAFRDIPMICMTGTEASDHEIMAGGFNGVLRKPVTLQEVMDIVDLAGVKPAVAKDPA